MTIKKKIIEDLNKKLDDNKLWISPGHFYSPITNDSSFVRNDIRGSIPGIDLNDSTQLKLLKEFGIYYKNMPFTARPNTKNRYYFENDQFSYSDAISLYSFMMHFKPKKIIEVGSGYSSALMLDVNNQFLDNRIDLTFIEPYPTRLKSLLRESDTPAIIEKDVQSVPIKLFNELSAGDVLFIDSSHVSKSGSDVNWLYHEIIPILKPGVIVHVHDIQYPYEYPKEWITQGRSWNEIYMLRCLLSDSPRYKILFWASYLHKHKSDLIGNILPLSKKNTGGSIWFEIQQK